jgi:hypothetical protein
MCPLQGAKERLPVQNLAAAVTRSPGFPPLPRVTLLVAVLQS